jgi:uncharacterized protein (TIGR03435 family)
MKNAIVILGVCLSATAQTPPSFDVASVKPAIVSGPLRVNARVNPDGINFVNVTLRQCVQRAFGIKSYQFVGPDWMNTERFTIVAKAAGPQPEARTLQMAQTLLAERFKLAYHRETKEIAIYALVVGKNGIKMKAAADDAVSQIDGGPGNVVTFEAVPLEMLAATIANDVDRPVLDQTGLKGKYTFDLKWAERKRKGPAPTEAPDAFDSPSIFTAVQERLGLKLEPRRAPVEMFVIDRIERPVE